MYVYLVYDPKKERLLGAFNSRELAYKSIVLSYSKRNVDIYWNASLNTWLHVKDNETQEIEDFNIQPWLVYDQVTHL